MTTRPCADEEHALRKLATDPGLQLRASFDPNEDVAAPFVARGAKVAILREQGVNGQTEMAAAFDRAGFREGVDVHMSDVLEGRRALDAFHGVAACNGFSYSDVLGAGELGEDHPLPRRGARGLRAFLRARGRLLARRLQRLPDDGEPQAAGAGAKAWPRFVRNRSERFEARLVMVRIEESPSVFFRGMAGSVLPIAVFEEGRAESRTSTRSRAAASSRRARRSLRRGDADLPAQPERLAEQHPR
ncbi:MAG: phosphoribosylformylglycinamidine synthase subunit PurQ [Polyangiales bacterium]